MGVGPSAVLSGLLLNVALYALIRFKVLTDGALERPFASALLMGFGLLSVAVAAFFLSRQRDIKRMFAYSPSAWGDRWRALQDCCT
jgi:hydrogenase-4 component F